jgi:hypothetical protein
MRLRPPSDADWPAIHAVANEALPNAPEGNTGWLEARKALPSDQLRRRHYVIEDEGGMVAGYGGIEPAGPRGWFRLFVVIAPKRLDGGAGDLVLVRLLEDARDLGAIAFWMREHADDPLVSWMLTRGFVEARRYTLGPEHGAYAGVAVAEIEHRL